MTDFLNPKVVRVGAKILDEEGQYWRVTDIGVSSLQTGKYSSFYVELTSVGLNIRVQLSAIEFETTFSRYVELVD